jgi:hypothetical protein
MGEYRRVLLKRGEFHLGRRGWMSTQNQTSDLNKSHCGSRHG